MNKLNMVAATLIAAMSMTAYGANDMWSHESSLDDFTGDRKEFAWIDTDTFYEGSLYIRCLGKGQDIDIYVTNDKLVDYHKRESIEVMIDGERDIDINKPNVEPRKAKKKLYFDYNRGKSGDTAFLHHDESSVLNATRHDLLIGLARGNEVKIKVPMGYSHDRVFVFTLKGSAAAIKPVADLCGYEIN